MPLSLELANATALISRFRTEFSVIDEMVYEMNHILSNAWLINESCTLALLLLLLDTFFRHTEASAGCNFVFEFASRIHRFWCKVTKCPN